jgi:hypothetical protein
VSFGNIRGRQVRMGLLVETKEHEKKNAKVGYEKNEQK